MRSVHLDPSAHNSTHNIAVTFNKYSNDNNPFQNGDGMIGKIIHYFNFLLFFTSYQLSLFCLIDLSRTYEDDGYVEIKILFPSY